MQNSKTFPESSLTAKLASLIALGGGIFALPQAADAQISYTPLNVKVGFGGGDQSQYSLNLPGDNDLIFGRFSGGGVKSILAFSNTHVATAHRQASVQAYSAGGKSFAKRAAAGATFNTIANKLTVAAFVLANHAASGTAIGPGSFSHKYVSFVFKDTDHSDAVKYGWVELSGTSSLNPSITLEGWAYQNDGSKIAMGAVPEPQAAALATGTALVLGAAGLRAWRKRQAARVTA